jgi:DNA-binding MarR family transcriptional regulator
MSSTRPQRTGLAVALQRYLDARSAALIEARRVLRINDLDARALLFIAEFPGTRPGTLREYLGITSAGITTLIDRLVERGAVRRDIDKGDRRVNRITVTVDLDQEPWSALTRFDDALDEAVTASDEEDMAQFADALVALTDAATAGR